MKNIQSTLLILTSLLVTTVIPASQPDAQPEQDPSAGAYVLASPFSLPAISAIGPGTWTEEVIIKHPEAGGTAATVVEVYLDSTKATKARQGMPEALGKALQLSTAADLAMTGRMLRGLPILPEGEDDSEGKFVNVVKRAGSPSDDAAAEEAQGGSAGEACVHSNLNDEGEVSQAAGAASEPA